MRIFLIRHGETVDNIAQVYAGSRDSELTNHGFQQAVRLGRHLIAIGHAFTHIFSSSLQRAFKTAELIREAQMSANSTLPCITNHVPDVKRLPILREQDFGFYEGKLWHQGPSSSNKSIGRDVKGNTSSFADVETKESMITRMDAFLDEHLVPLIEQSSNEDAVIAIVSHGIILSVLWRRLLTRLPANSITYAPELLTTRRNPRLQHLGAWSNTGYMEFHMRKETNPLLSQPAVGPSVPAEHLDTQAGAYAQADSVASKNTEVSNYLSHTKDAQTFTAPAHLYGWTTVIKTINCRDHLQGLKRTGGGVGAARYDDSQKSIETFFKRRRTS
ncbi:phosphoglycerate mutase-like protein [Glonium stellatum]|uniref:Phosphoglycerate mutase-like protein n=1 Tax=Glonium stellatum TaxID=574774 RepID=A0A8E2F1L2_9PEZI|nr:phosphoglycerate mutase-like protein [Glonium stellatum]